MKKATRKWTVSATHVQSGHRSRMQYFSTAIEAAQFVEEYRSVDEWRSIRTTSKREVE